MGLFILKGVFDYGQAYLMSFVGRGSSPICGKKFTTMCSPSPCPFLPKNPTGVLMSRIMNDVNSCSGAVTDAVTGLPQRYFHDYRAGVRGVLSGLAAGSDRPDRFPRGRVPHRQVWTQASFLQHPDANDVGGSFNHAFETISGTRIVKAFNMEDYERKRFSRMNEKIFQILLKSFRVRAISHPLMETLGGLGIAAIVFYGGYNVIQGTATPGTFFFVLGGLTDALRTGQAVEQRE